MKVARHGSDEGNRKLRRLERWRRYREDTAANQVQTVNEQRQTAAVVSGRQIDAARRVN